MLTDFVTESLNPLQYNAKSNGEFPDYVHYFSEGDEIWLESHLKLSIALCSFLLSTYCKKTVREQTISRR